MENSSKKLTHIASLTVFESIVSVFTLKSTPATVQTLILNFFSESVESRKKITCGS